MRLIISILFFSLILTSLSAITFERTYGRSGFDDWAEAVQQTTDFGYIIGGNASSDRVRRDHLYLIKTDSLGDTIWSTVTTFVTGDLKSVIETDDQGFLVLAEDYTYSHPYFILIKYDSAGEQIWYKHLGNYETDEIPYSLKKTTDSNFVCIGVTNDSIVSAGKFDVWLVKVDTSGNILWDKTYGGIEDDEGCDLDVVTDGYIIVGGTSSYGMGIRDVYLIRIDSLGDTLWTRTYGGVNDDVGMSVEQTSDDSFIIAGATYSFGGGNYDIYLIKTDSSGDTLWTRTYGGAGWDGAFGICQSADSCHVIVGETMSYGAGGSDVYLLKIDPDGNLLWSKTYGWDDEDRGFDVKLTADSGFIISGMTRGPNGVDRDIYFLKTDAQGNISVAEEDIKRLKSLKIYPNPSYGKVNLDLPNNIEGINLFDATGRQIKRFQPTQKLKIELSPGIYFLQIKTQNHTKTEKIIILR